MKNKMLTVLALFAPACAAFAEAAGVSVSAVTYLREDASILWRTIVSSAPKIALDWPAGAASAALTTKIGDGAAQTATLDDTSAKYCTLVFETPQSVAAREIVTLSISYLDGKDAEISSQTVKLGLVDGVGNGASVATPLSSGADWARFEKHRVVQIPPDATAVTLDGAPVDCDIPGWFDLAAGPGRHILALETGSGTDSATVMKSGNGIVIIFR